MKDEITCFIIFYNRTIHVTPETLAPNLQRIRSFYVNSLMNVPFLASRTGLCRVAAGVVIDPLARGNKFTGLSVKVR
jgi:hypothetical protein